MTSLKDVIKKQGLQLSTVQRHTRDIFSGLEFLHANNIMHRDIKPANLLLDRNERIRIADFGLASIVHQPHHDFNVVTPLYRPLEVFYHDTNYSLPVDVWSAACVVAEMVSGSRLFRVPYPKTNKSSVDPKQHVCVISAMLGTPTNNDWPGVEDLPRYKQFHHIEDSTLYPSGLPDLGDAGLNHVLAAGLKLDPAMRFTAKEAREYCEKQFFSAPSASSAEPAKVKKRPRSPSPSSSSKVHVHTGIASPTPIATYQTRTDTGTGTASSSESAVSAKLIGTEFIKAYMIQLMREDLEEEEKCNRDTFPCSFYFTNKLPIQSITSGEPVINANVNLVMRIGDCMQYTPGLAVCIEFEFLGKELKKFDGIIHAVHCSTDGRDRKDISVRIRVDAPGPMDVVPEPGEMIDCNLTRKYNKNAFVRQMDSLKEVHKMVDEGTKLHEALELLLGVYNPHQFGTKQKSTRDCHTIDQRQAAKANTEQLEAVMHAQQHLVTIVDGAVGTGKSHVAKLCVEAWIKKGKRVLVSASTNNACGDLARGLHALGVNVTLLQSRTEERKRGAGQAFAYTLRGKIENRISNSTANINGSVWNKLRYWREQTSKEPNDAELSKLIEEAENFFIQDSSAVCCTLACARDRRMKRLPKAGILFGALCVEEAGQARVAEVMNALLLCEGNSNALFIGDPCQLSPYLLNKHYHLLGESCFARLVDNEGISTVTLIEQGRMREPIARVVSKLCYGNRLQTADFVKDRELCPGLKGNYNPEVAAAWVDVSIGVARKCGDSWYHDGQIEIACDLAQYYDEHGVLFEDMYFITPFVANKIRLISALEMRFQGRSFSERVGTIDGSQGKECAIVFFLPVRPTTFNTMPRFTVAISRARDQLIILSDPYPFFKQPLVDPLRMLLEMLNDRDCLFAGISFPYQTQRLQTKPTEHFRFVPDLCRYDIVHCVQDKDPSFTLENCVDAANKQVVPSTGSAQASTMSNVKTVQSGESQARGADTGSKSRAETKSKPPNVKAGKSGESQAKGIETVSKSRAATESKVDEASGKEETVMHGDSQSKELENVKTSPEISDSKKAENVAENVVEDSPELDNSFDSEAEDDYVHQLALDPNAELLKPIDEYPDCGPFDVPQWIRDLMGNKEADETISSDLEDLGKYLVCEADDDETPAPAGRKPAATASASASASASLPSPPPKAVPLKKTVKKIQKWWSAHCEAGCTYVHLQADKSKLIKSAMDVYANHYIRGGNQDFDRVMGDALTKTLKPFAHEGHKFPF
eukprot:gene10041-11768_t